LNYDLVLMDAHMPVMDGTQATREIRASPVGGEVSIIAVTADALTSQNRKLKEAGVDAVLTKPYTDSELMALVTKFGVRNLSTPGLAITGGAATEDWRANDEVEFKNFAANRDPEMVRNLLSLGAESTREQVEKLRDAILAEDLNAIFFAAHRLKGASGSMFAGELAALAGALEAASEDPARIAEFFSKLEAAATAALVWWSERVRELEG
jgi:CheY-like chemotaxis protein